MDTQGLDQMLSVLRTTAAQAWEFLFEERLNAGIFKADGIKQPCRCFVEPRPRIAAAGGKRKTLGNDAAEPLRIKQAVVFTAVAKRARRGNHRIPETNPRDGYRKIRRSFPGSITVRYQNCIPPYHFVRAARPESRR